MIALLLPLLAIGAIAILARQGRSGPAALPGLTLARPGVRAAGAAPSPLLVLDGFLASGQVPPPFVIACAIAEAEAMGRMDVSSVLVEAFVIPMVAQARAAEVAQARDANPWDWGGSPSSAWASACPIMPPASMPMSTPMPTPGHGHPAASRPPAPRHHGHHGHHDHPYPQAPPHSPSATSWSPGGDGSPQAAAWAPVQARASVESATGPTPGLRSIADPAYARVDLLERIDRANRAAASTSTAASQASPSPTPGRARSPGPNRDTITVSGMNSPIADIPNEAWADFARRVARESPSFTSPRHLGQYRQRKDRLASLGFDPDELSRIPDLQGTALAADMVDAHRHLSDSGLIAEYRGVVIEIPQTPSGDSVPVEVTLSGIMGVAQAAGLEGATAWFDDASDRVRFPHTTAAFLRTNGVF